MNLSEAGRIIVVDDKEGEAKDLLRALAKKSLPYLYYDSSPQYLPSKPMKGVRFIFLDLDLKGSPVATGTDRVKNMASEATSVLVKLISKDNGPYFLLFWSDNSLELGTTDQVLKNLKLVGLSPSGYLDIEKPNCRNIKGNFDITLITKSIKEKISSIGSFRLFVEWENAINDAIKLQIFEIFDSFNKLEDWNDRNKMLFYKLYKAVIDDDSQSDARAKQNYLMRVLNRAFLAKTENILLKTKPNFEIWNDNSIPEDFFEKHFLSNTQITSKYKKDKSNNKYVLNAGQSEASLKKLKKELTLEINNLIGEETLAKMNSSLFLSKCLSKYPLLGYVYKQKNEKLLRDLSNYIFDSFDDYKDASLCKIILTPECDIAQDKTLMHLGAKKNYRIHRVVYGMLFPYQVKLKSDSNKKDILFSIGPIWYNSKISRLIVHFASISCEDEKKIGKNPIFSINRDLIFDLQSKASNHVNRLGNFQLEIN